MAFRVRPRYDALAGRPVFIMVIRLH